MPGRGMRNTGHMGQDGGMRGMGGGGHMPPPPMNNRQYGGLGGGYHRRRGCSGCFFPTLLVAGMIIGLIGWIV